MKKLWGLYVKANWDRKILFTAGALALLPFLFAAVWSCSTPVLEAKPESAQVDTYIPKGFVLVPIEVQNYEALDSILGQFGVVDLFQSAESPKARQQLVARNVRILRAPQNPAHFAILVQESEVSSVLKAGTPFFVVVKDRSTGKNGTEFVKGEMRPKRPIVYEGE